MTPKLLRRVSAGLALAMTLGLGAAACGSDDGGGGKGSGGSGGTAQSGGGSGGTQQSGGSGGLASGGAGSGGLASGGAAGSGGGVSDAGTDAPINWGPYPAGPYGNNVGDTIANLAWEGYANTTGAAASDTLPYGDYSTDDMRKSGKPYGLIHISAFT